MVARQRHAPKHNVIGHGKRAVNPIAFYGQQPDLLVPLKGECLPLWIVSPRPHTHHDHLALDDFVGPNLQLAGDVGYGFD